MKTLAAAVICALLSPALGFAAPAEGPRTEEQKTLYALGVWLAQKAELTAADLKYVHMGLKL